MTSDLDSETPAAPVPGAPLTGLENGIELKKTSDAEVRKWVSYLLLALLTGIVIVAFGELIYINMPVIGSAITDSREDAARLMSLMNVVFGPIVTLFSSVVGFYFGARTAKESGNN